MLPLRQGLINHGGHIMQYWYTMLSILLFPIFAPRLIRDISRTR